MNVRWVKAAEEDRADILLYIGAYNPAAAFRIDELFAETARKLADFPIVRTNRANNWNTGSIST
ncbi:MAG: type II toxin-antitoxin system RelE/ParE family toxin [Synergistaceae bacterium]|nr:type II toxin-antitoxin system RelE/ParE family toxin [Synergistaceae bacterium]